MTFIIGFIEILLSFLIILMIFYVIRLNRNLAQLQRSKSEMESTLERFIGATNRAQKTLDNIKENISLEYKHDYQQLVTRIDDLSQQINHIQPSKSASKKEHIKPLPTSATHNNLSKTIRHLEHNNNPKSMMPQYQKKALLQELKKIGLG